MNPAEQMRYNLLKKRLLTEIIIAGKLTNFYSEAGQNYLHYVGNFDGKEVDMICTVEDAIWELLAQDMDMAQAGSVLSAVPGRPASTRSANKIVSTLSQEQVNEAMENWDPNGERDAFLCSAELKKLHLLELRTDAANVYIDYREQNGVHILTWQTLAYGWHAYRTIADPRAQAVLAKLEAKMGKDAVERDEQQKEQAKKLLYQQPVVEPVQLPPPTAGAMTSVAAELGKFGAASAPVPTPPAPPARGPGHTVTTTRLIPTRGGGYTSEVINVERIEGEIMSDEEVARVEASLPQRPSNDTLLKGLIELAEQKLGGPITTNAGEGFLQIVKADTPPTEAAPWDEAVPHFPTSAASDADQAALDKTMLSTRDAWPLAVRYHDESHGSPHPDGTLPPLPAPSTTVVEPKPCENCSKQCYGDQQHGLCDDCVRLVPQFTECTHEVSKKPKATMVETTTASGKRMVVFDLKPDPDDVQDKPAMINPAVPAGTPDPEKQKASNGPTEIEAKLWKKALNHIKDMEAGHGVQSAQLTVDGVTVVYLNGGGKRITAFFTKDHYDKLCTPPEEPLAILFRKYGVVRKPIVEPKPKREPKAKPAKLPAPPPAALPKLSDDVHPEFGNVPLPQLHEQLLPLLPPQSEWMFPEQYLVAGQRPPFEYEGALPESDLIRNTSALGCYFDAPSMGCAQIRVRNAVTSGWILFDDEMRFNICVGHFMGKMIGALLNSQHESLDTPGRVVKEWVTYRFKAVSIANIYQMVNAWWPTASWVTQGRLTRSRRLLELAYQVSKADWLQVPPEVMALHWSFVNATPDTYTFLGALYKGKAMYSRPEEQMLSSLLQRYESLSKK